MSKRGKIILWVVIAIIIVAILVAIIVSTLNTTTSLDFDDFVKRVEYGTLYNKYYIETTDEEGNTLYVENPNPEEYNSNQITVAAYNGWILSEADYEGFTIINDDNGIKRIYDKNDNEVEYIAYVEIDQYAFYGYVYNSSGRLYRTYKSYGPSLYSSDALNEDSLASYWMNMGVGLTFSNPNSGSYWSTIISIVAMIVIVIIFWLLIRSSMSSGGRNMSFGKSKAKVSTNVKTRFTDVAGADEEKVELAEVVEFLKNPKKFNDLGAKTPKGVLLVGPPGTGKTLFAKAVAGEAGVPFFSVSGSDFVELYVGMGASRVRDLFDMAKKSAPCIVFIDEIDAVGRQRGAGLGGGNDEREQTLNQILVAMDGFESNESVIVMAATNRADILDPALMRPGRFDRQVYVNLPDVKGREQILKVHARNKPLAEDVNFKTLARITAGFSGADLANLLNEAAILAARNNKTLIGNTELYEGVNKVLMGPQKKSRVVTESDKRITAYHESGHAIIARLCEHCDPVQEVSIIPRGNAAGYTMTRPDNDDVHMSRQKILDFICMALGGRAAEELVIKDITTGASNDLERITDMAKRMVTEWGMSERLGLVTYGSNSQTVFLGRDMETHNAYSEETARAIDEEMHSIVDTQYERAKKFLTDNRPILDNMTRVLIEKETIYTEEVDMLMEGKSYTEVIAAMEENEKAFAGNPFKRYEQNG
ncbi:MAG: ATP-dependent zinc metalloprotease FtsH [Clostridia bacterium]|nr:ATP-dependent zinc metalloprotease FtsH [Clostridia bacterium]